MLVHTHRHVAFPQDHDARQQQPDQVHHVLPLDLALVAEVGLHLLELRHHVAVVRLVHQRATGTLLRICSNSSASGVFVSTSGVYRHSSTLGLAFSARMMNFWISQYASCVASFSSCSGTPYSDQCSSAGGR